mmetsp:Transcript_542/g.1287  ORF Transcript_542/g.1287 Transcript_542/m.1287 type:complete len:177 (-) Transcript_542:531-1061(-)
MFEDFVESEFFILSQKYGSLIEKKKFEKFLKSLWTFHLIFRHNLVVLHLIEKSVNSSDWNVEDKKVPLDRDLVFLRQKKFPMKNIDCPFLGLPFHLKTETNKYQTMWRDFEGKKEIDWNFNILKKKKVGKKFKIPPPTKKKIYNGKIRFLNSKKKAHLNSFSKKKSSRILALKNLF